ncbi:MAG: protein translocase subunit SecD, partial [Spirochaetales bacterium]|nr:protein translocase subunit SecD [Spirochaetales bacterium]
MTKRGRFLIVLLVLAVAGMFLYPTFEWYFITPKSLIDLASGSKEQIRLYALSEAGRVFEQLSTLRESGEPVPEKYGFLIKAAEKNYKLEKMDIPKMWTVDALFKGFSSQKEFFTAIETHYRDMLLAIKDRNKDIMQLGLDLSGGMRVVLEADIESLEKRLGHSASTEDKEDAITRAMEILTNRIDKFGVSEPSIRRQGEDQISIEIPGAEDPERVRTFLMGKGSLVFHIVDQDMSQAVAAYMQENPNAQITADGKIRNADIVAAGYRVVGFYTKDSYGVDEWQRWVVIEDEVGLDGGHIQQATVSSHPITGKPVVNFQLDREGGEIFFKLTSENVDKTLAVVMDDKVKTMANISEAIRDSVQVTGFERTEANDLALILRTAALPVDLVISTQQAIGAALGEDSIAAGLKAIQIGFLLVIAFMLVWYKGAGFVADIALLLNLVIMVAILSAFNLTLTLTSIAGLILTVGMAVDANVIIFERIKEEYALGK